jgi:hypothetical protein
MLAAILMWLFAWAAAQTPPAPGIVSAPKPEMIGEGILSTADDEFGGSLSPDGKTIYYDITVPAHYLYVICESHLVNGKWQKPEVLPFSGLYRDSDPVLSPDGNTLMFASDRQRDGKDEHSFSIWAATRTGNGWSEPHLMEGPINSAGSQIFASRANNGNLYFTSTRNNKGQIDIFRSRLVDGKYQPAEDLGPNVNEDGVWSLEALIAPDETYLLIGSFGRQPGFGNSDLYISYNQDGVWSKPRNLGPVINTAAREYSPRISPDSKWLIYTSEQGMQTEKRDRAFTSEEFSRKARGLYNGLGNMYRIPIDYVLQSTSVAPATRGQ